jgi:hypothetical protein
MDASGAGAPGTTAPTPPVVPSQWSTLSPELQGYVETKGFKDVSGAIESYRNMEKLLGVPKERILKLPEKADDAEGWKNVYSRLGCPEKPAGYELKMPEGIGDEGFAQWAKDTFHGLGLSKNQGENLTTKWNEYVQKQMEKTTADYNSQVEQEEASLKTEWGAAYDQNINLAKRAAQTFGIDEETADKLEESMGVAKVMKMFHSMATKLSEDQFVSGDGGSPKFGVMTPEAAKARIQQLKGDPEFRKRYAANGADELAEMKKLHRWAYPGEVTI